jgi:hypothetical protein
MTLTNRHIYLPVSLERDLNIIGVRRASSLPAQITRALPVSSQTTVLDANNEPEF